MLKVIQKRSQVKKKHIAVSCPFLVSHLVQSVVQQHLSVFCASINLAKWQNLVPLVNIKIAGKWMFMPLKMVLIGIDP